MTDRYSIAVQHIVNLTKLNESLQTRLTAQDAEINRLRVLNERIALPNGAGPGGVPIVASQHKMTKVEDENTELPMGSIGVPVPVASVTVQGAAPEYHYSNESGQMAEPSPKEVHEEY